jgi:hypothetical protein
MKSLSSVLNVETNRVDNTLGAGNGRLHGPLVMCVSGDPFDTSILAQPTMARDYAHPGARLGQMAHDTTAKATDASVLTVEQEKAQAARPGSDFKECARGCRSRRGEDMSQATSCLDL